jgi:hypothetical protein
VIKAAKGDAVLLKGSMLEEHMEGLGGVTPQAAGAGDGALAGIPLGPGAPP